MMLWLFGMQSNSDVAMRAGDFDNWLHRIASIVPETIGWSDFSGRECPPAMQVWVRDLTEDGSSSVLINGKLTKTDEVVGVEINDGGAAHGWLVWVLAPASIENELASELPMQLQIERESLFNEFDRVRAESELRAAIIVPLTILISVMVAVSVYWIFAFVLPIWLLRQAVQAYFEADQRLRSAVRHGAIRSSTIEFMKSLGREDKTST